MCILQHCKRIVLAFIIVHNNQCQQLSLIKTNYPDINVEGEKRVSSVGHVNDEFFELSITNCTMSSSNKKGNKNVPKTQ